MKQYKGDHQQNWYSSRVHGKAFRDITLEQENQAALKPAPGTFQVQVFF